MRWVKSGAQQNPLKGQSEIPATVRKKPISFNFGQLDTRQGQTLDNWSNSGLLLKMVTRFKDHGLKPIYDCYNDKFKCYDSFPETKKTDFKRPSHIPEDAIWASMHLQGKECVIGHVSLDIFFVVFLDAEHRFYISEKK